MIDVIEPLQHAHEMAKVGEDEMKQMLEMLAEAYPQLGEEMQKNTERYGVATLAGSLGARWAEDLPQDVYDLLQFQYRPIEIVLRPEDAYAHHWSVDWYLLEWHPDKGYIRIIDKER